jgi:23S rRNA pseudouridine1911/1915/1917 synthase
MSERRPLRPRHLITANGAEQIVVPPFGAGMRLDAFLARFAEGRSRTEWQRMIENGAITLDGRPVRPSDRVEGGQRVQVAPPTVPITPRTPRPSTMPLTIVYEDPAMIVVNKPPGLVVHPAPGHEDGTLVNALVARFPDLSDPSGERRPGIVHRLDKDTSGLLVVGRTTAAMAALQLQFKERTARKKYLLLVQGDLAEEEAAIEAPIGRDPRDRQRMTARTGGREARTQFTVLERYGDYTLVEADLQSGRTHQLRVHFQFIGHSVAGDKTYGNGRGPSGLRRQFVHASLMRIVSPHDGAMRELFAPLPADLRSPLERLRVIRGFPPETLPEAVTESGDRASTPESEDVLAVPGARGRLGGAPTPAPARPRRTSGQRPSEPRAEGRPPRSARRTGAHRSTRPPKRGKHS